MTGLVDPVGKLRELYRQWSETRGGNPDAWLAILADDVRIVSLGGGAPGIEFTRGGRGKDAARGYLAGLTGDWEMKRYQVDQFIVEGDWVVVLGSCLFENRRTRKPAESAKADVYRFRDGLVVEFREFYDTAGLIAAATP